MCVRAHHRTTNQPEEQRKRERIYQISRSETKQNNKIKNEKEKSKCSNKFWTFQRIKTISHRYESSWIQFESALWTGCYAFESWMCEPLPFWLRTNEFIKKKNETTTTTTTLLWFLSSLPFTELRRFRVDRLNVFYTQIDRFVVVIVFVIFEFEISFVTNSHY